MANMTRDQLRAISPAAAQALDEEDARRAKRDNVAKTDLATIHTLTAHSPAPAPNAPETKPAGAPRVRQHAEAPDGTRFFVSAGLPKPEREFRFERSRRWRMDYAWPAQKVAMEVEGGVWTGGRHTRGKGFLGDIEKYNHAAVLGWRIVRITPNAVLSVTTVELLRKLLG